VQRSYLVLKYGPVFTFQVDPGSSATRLLEWLCLASGWLSVLSCVSYSPQERNNAGSVFVSSGSIARLIHMKYAVRVLGQEKAFATFAILTLALGIACSKQG
jgi:hypothetical protein